MAIDSTGAVTSPIGKFLGEGGIERVAEAAGASPGDLVLIVADAADVANAVLGKIRTELGTRLGLLDKTVLAHCWVHRFPMYQWDTELGRWDATHNPFSGVVPEDEPLLATASGDPAQPSPHDPAGRARALQYDVVLNGWELGGGSIRIHRRDVQERVFEALGIPPDEARERFGFLLDAFRYGAPPHGGIAFGMDRVVALMAGLDNIRDVSAFPKTSSGADLLTGAPAPLDAQQLRELGVSVQGGP